MSMEELQEKIDSGEYELSDVVRVQPRWRSWAMWLSVLGAVWTILNAFGLPQTCGIEESTFKTVVDAIGVILIGFGVLNNPTDPDHF